MTREGKGGTSTSSSTGPGLITTAGAQLQAAILADGALARAPVIQIHMTGVGKGLNTPALRFFNMAHNRHC